MLRALIVTLALARPASADLWTAPPLGSAAPSDRRTLGPSTPESPAPNKESRDGPRDRPFTLTVVVDPACAVSLAVVQDALAFARVHPDVGVRVWLAMPPTRSREGLRALVAAAETGATVAWAPGVVRRLAPAALPAVFLEDGQGRGARATGRPPLEALWRAVVRRSGS